MPIDDGGPAFPCPNDCKNGEMGLSLLDYFAGQMAPAVALFSELAYAFDKRESVPSIQEVASDSYRFAEAMIREKRRREQSDPVPVTQDTEG